MYKVKIEPHKLEGNIIAPPSKSDAHRAIICASLANGISKINNIEYSNDINATIDAMKTIGAKITKNINSIIIKGININSHNNYANNLNIDCNESASTLRFIIPICATLGIDTLFVGKGRLFHRPLEPYLKLFSQHNISYSYEHGAYLSITGKLQGDLFNIDGNISSQFISGLLFAIPLLKIECKIHLTTKLESSNYVDMTIHTLKKFGIIIHKTDYGFLIPGAQEYIPSNYNVEGDWSQTAFFIVAGCIGNNIKISGLNYKSLQGDKKIVDIVKDFNGNISWNNEILIIKPSSLNGNNIDATEIPDLAPILTVLASLSNGYTKIYNGSRLRLKESDRLSSISQALKDIGANLVELQDELIIKGVPYFQSKGKIIDGANDHRIVMSIAIAAIKSKNIIEISNPYSVNKSYPTFFKHYNFLGGNANVVHMG